jgi:molecular chaperone DnaJ
MVTAEEIAKQISKHIEITRIVPCGVCNGTGAQARALIKCPKCGGNGIDVVASVMGEKKFCSGCGGYGTVQPDRNCKSCEGKGLLTVKVRKEIKLSKKFTLEQISFPREGHFVLGSETPGNLVIKPILEKKSPFEVDGKNIRGKARISPAQAVLGDIYYVDVFGEMIKIEIKPHTKDGAIIELKDKGVQKGKSRGALILKVIIEIPNKITEEERKLYDQLLSIQKGTNL